MMPIMSIASIWYMDQMVNIHGIDRWFHFGAVPNIYPVELFERIWGVDRLERLGVAQYFESEIKIKCLDYLYR